MNIKNIITSIFLIAFLFISNSIIFSEEPDTLITKSDLRRLFKGLEYTPYISPTVKYTKFDSDTALLAGGNLGLMLNGLNFAIGYYHHTKYINRDVDDTNGITADEATKVKTGYGGGLLGYHFFRKNLFNFSINSLFGAGVAQFNTDADSSKKKDYFFVAEPELNIFLNLAKFCRLGVGGTYRYVKGIDRGELTADDYSGYSVQIILQLGWF